jgi:hypothetical protein
MQRIEKNRISAKRLEQLARANFYIFGSQNHPLGQGRHLDYAVTRVT